MKRYNCTSSDKRGAFGLCMEEHKEGMFVPFSEVAPLNQRINQLLEERNSTGIAISNAIRSGVMPDKHPLRSRLELLANHHRFLHLLADLLRESKESIYLQLESPDSNLSGEEAGRLIDLQERIDAALAGKMPERTKPDAGYLNGAKDFKSMMLEASTALFHPHIEGVFAVFEQRLALDAQPQGGEQIVKCPHCNAEFQDGSDAAEFIGWHGLCSSCELKGGEPCATEPLSSSPA